jgi:cell division protein FtsI (penicillin-binding protein 3)
MATLPRGNPAAQVRADATSVHRRALVLFVAVLAGFAIVAGQLVRLAGKSRPEVRLSITEPISTSWSRPDIVDRNGRLIATDVEVHSLYADPALVLDVDEAVEKISDTLPEVDAGELRRNLADKSRRFAWVRRGLSPLRAQRVHELGLPGFGLRKELKRVYPADALAGHIIGSVNLDNRGQSGIERHIDETGGAEPVLGPGRLLKSPLRLSLDLGVQQSLAEELASALIRYAASAAAGIVLDAKTGEVLASVSLPEVDPSRPTDALDPDRIDRLTSGTYELGSIFKAFTVAMALESGQATLEKMYDVRELLKAGPYTITDLHPQGKPLSVRDIFLHSSNVGAGMIAIEAGSERQRAFLTKLGLTEPIRTEAGPVAAPLTPQRWDRVATITIAYGHGLAVAPVQFAAAFATLVNGGHKVTATFRARADGVAPSVGERLLSTETSARMVEILRLNVTSSAGTGRRAEVEGYRIGGKTGTAEIAGPGGYRQKSVISSFAAAFPMDQPAFVMLVLLFEPHGSEETKGNITAATNAAPTTARVVRRIAPLLGVLPRQTVPRPEVVTSFDAQDDAQ